MVWLSALLFIWTQQYRFETAGAGSSNARLLCLGERNAAGFKLLSEFRERWCSRCLWGANGWDWLSPCAPMLSVLTELPTSTVMRIVNNPTAYGAVLLPRIYPGTTEVLAHSCFWRDVYSKALFAWYSQILNLQISSSCYDAWQVTSYRAWVYKEHAGRETSVTCMIYQMWCVASISQLFWPNHKR